MTVLDDVRALIVRLSPQAICDHCIAERLRLSVRQHANHKTRELAGGGGFERRKDLCSLCASEKLVIRKTFEDPARSGGGGVPLPARTRL